MTREKLGSYQMNKKLIERNNQRIEDEKLRKSTMTAGVVKGSSHEFPYIERRFTVDMEDPEERKKQQIRIERWRQEIRYAREEMEEVEEFIYNIENARDREIFISRYIDGMKTVEIAEQTGYTHGRISQIVSRYLKH